MGNDWEVIQKSGKIVLRVGSDQIRVPENDAADLAVQVLIKLGWNDAADAGVKIGEHEPQSVEPTRVRSTLERIAASGGGVRGSQVTRRQLSSPWTPTPDLVDERPRRRFTKEPASAPAPAKAPVRKVVKTVAAMPNALPDVQLYEDDEENWRYLVHHFYLLTVPPGQRAQYPLGTYDMSATFLRDLATLKGAVSDQQVVAAILDVVSGRAADVNSRMPRPMREGGGEESRPQIVRADGALAWRANVSQGTPAARRIMWWTLPDGTLELARLAVHDDVRMA
jgi:hypothetical protein